METRYTVADVSLLVGGVMLTGAALTFVLRPKRERPVPVEVGIAPGGATARVRF